LLLWGDILRAYDEYIQGDMNMTNTDIIQVTDKTRIVKLYTSDKNPRTRCFVGYSVEGYSTLSNKWFNLHVNPTETGAREFILKHVRS
jgi:hypothetical protein